MKTVTSTTTSKASKMTSTQRLNAVQKFLVEFANEKGIDLRKEFGTVAKFKEFVIALSIKALLDAGLEMKVALDAVLGDGTYDGIVEQVWNQAQAH